MTIALQGTDALAAKASTGGVVTVAVWGRIVGTNYQNLVPAAAGAPVTIGTGIASYYTPGGTAQAIVALIQMANPSGAAVTITQYAQTGAGQTQVGQWIIPALGRLEYSQDGWKLYDGTGNAQTVGNTGAQGIAGIAASAIMLEPDQGEEGMPVPGPIGLTGPQGIQGVQGPQGIAASAISIEPDQGEEGLAIPGPVGNTGATGAQGIQGLAGPTVFFDADQGEDGMVVPGGVTSVGATAPITSSGGANPTIGITAATPSASGAMTAAFANTVTNLWYDVTNYGVLIGNSATLNTTNLNTLIQTTAPAGARIFFPQTGANYPFNGSITVTKNSQTFLGTGQFDSVLFWSGSTTGDFFVIQDGINQPTFEDLGFWSTVVQTAGSTIQIGTAAGTGVPQFNIYRCGFQGFGGNWFNNMTFSGTRSGEVSTVEDCVHASFTGWATGIVGNTTTPGTTSAIVFNNMLANGSITGTTGAVAGVYVQQSGATEFVNCDLIQCTNNLLLSPITSVNQVVASVYAINSYFDSSHGSCVKLGGTEPIVRCKFVSCSMTVQADAGGNYSSFEISNTAANPPGDIDILNCNLQNTFNNTATTNGLLITTGANIKIIGNNINGWTNGIQATSSGAAGVTRLQIIGNNIGPGTITHVASATGILLNAGSFAYGLVHISNNVFPITNAFQASNTVNITDNSSMGVTTAATGFKFIQDNSGLITCPPANYAATAIPLTTITSVDSRGGLYFPPGVRPSSGRITIYATNAATIQTLTATVRFGTGNAGADTAIYTHAFGAGTAAVGSANFVIDWELLTATTMGICFKAYNGNVTTTTGMFPVASYFESLATPATISTTVNNWLGVSFSSATAAAITIRSVKYEVQSQ